MRAFVLCARPYEGPGGGRRGLGQEGAGLGRRGLPRGLGAQDMRYQAFATVEKVLGSIAALEQDRQFLVEKLREQQAAMAAVKKERQAAGGACSHLAPRGRNVL